jgi:hypothetical protein
LFLALHILRTRAAAENAARMALLLATNVAKDLWEREEYDAPDCLLMLFDSNVYEAVPVKRIG